MRTGHCDPAFNGFRDRKIAAQCEPVSGRRDWLARTGYDYSTMEAS